MLEAYASSRDQHLRSELMAAYDGFALALAWRFPSRRESTEDLVQVARLALLKAIDRFEPGRGRPFTAFARLTILGELKRHIRDHTWAMRVPRSLKEHFIDVTRAADELTLELGRSPLIPEVANRTGLSQEQVLEAMELGACHRPLALDIPRSESDSIPDPGREDEHFGRLEQQWLVSDLLSRLDDPDRDLLRMRFVDGLTQSEIASRRGCSQMHVSRTLVKTFTRLRALAEAR